MFAELYRGAQMKSSAMQLNLFEHVSAIYAGTDDGILDNNRLYRAVASRTGISNDELAAKVAIGTAGQEHSPLKRAIRWHQYTLFGLKFAWGGIIFFLILAGLFALRTLIEINDLFSLVSFGAAGAEILFLRVQHTGIGHFCPVCVVIAIAVITIACTRLAPYFWCAGKDWGKVAIRSAITILVIVTGFMTALVGVEQPQAQTASPAQTIAPVKISSLSAADIWFGNDAAPVEVYFISDWYCEYCRKSEKKMETSLPAVGAAARYTFLDMPVHKESFFIMPYHQSLLLNQKMKYLAGRRALLDATSSGNIPSQVDIVDALNKNGVQHHPADSGLIQGLQETSYSFFRKYGVKSTPSVIILNPTTNKHILLSGADKITPKRVLAAVNSIGDKTPTR
jgi:hypothetical protein